jgi:hypothetical protein
MEVASWFGRRKLDAEMGHRVYVIFVGIGENVQRRPTALRNLRGVTSFGVFAKRIRARVSARIDALAARL